jgi:hypothetical protein
MPVVSALVGSALILFVVVEAFEALVLPRRVTRPFRFTCLYYRAAWRVWATAAQLVAPSRSRQTVLSLFGPLSLLVLLAVWAACLIAGFGLLHHALAPERGLPDSFYLSGTTFTTLGYGDVTPTGPVPGRSR